MWKEAEVKTAKALITARILLRPIAWDDVCPPGRMGAIVREGSKQKFARILRSGMTDAEQLLWYRRRRRQLANQRFRRQVPIGPYVVDFVCLEMRIVIEVDGSQHMDSMRDQQRDAWLTAAGYRILRFWNHDVLSRTESVLAQILDVMATTCPHPASGHLPPQAGEGKQSDPGD